MFLQEIVQPRILEQVVACKDDIAQQYLMQCLIQGFPDEFHLASLDILLGTLPQLQLGVKVHIVLSSLLDRLGRCRSVFVIGFQTLQSSKWPLFCATGCQE